MGELMAVLDLFKSTAHVPEEPLHILCDSQYVINSVTKWMPGWKRKGWRKSDGKPVLNLELLREIDDALVGRKYTFEWVRGHAGHDLNEAADDRARDAATAHQGKRAPNAGPGFPGAQPADTQDKNVGQNESARQGMNDGGTTSPRQGSPAAALMTAAAPAGGSTFVGEPALFEDPSQPDLFSIFDDEPDPAFTAAHASGLDVIIAFEKELLDPGVRSDPLRLAELLHPDFEEIGASGVLWSRQDILDKLAGESAAEVELEVLTLNNVDAATALLTYRSLSAAGNALRSSLWQRDGEQWRLRFHQGTVER